MKSAFILLLRTFQCVSQSQQNGQQPGVNTENSEQRRKFQYRGQRLNVSEGLYHSVKKDFNFVVLKLLLIHKKHILDQLNNDYVT